MPKEKRKRSKHRRNNANRPFSGERNVLLALSVYNSEIHRGVARFGRDHNWHIPADLEDPVPKGWNGDGVLTQLGAPQEVWRRLRRLDVPIVDVAVEALCGELTHVDLEHATGKLGGQFGRPVKRNLEIQQRDRGIEALRLGADGVRPGQETNR